MTSSGSFLGIFALFGVIGWLVPIVVAQIIGQRNGREYEWVWAVVLGWLGVLIVVVRGPVVPPSQYQGPGWFAPGPPGGPQQWPPPAPPMPGEMKTCPRCAEAVKAAAQVCRYCGYEFPPAP